MIASELTTGLTRQRSPLGGSGLMSASSACKRSSRWVIGAVNLGVAVHTTSVEGEDIESRHGQMPTYNIYVALLTQLMAAPDQQTGLTGTVWRMAGEAVLLHRGVLPEQRTTLFRVAFKTCVIG